MRFLSHALFDLTGSTESVPVEQFHRQLALKLMTEDCNLLKVLSEYYVDIRRLNVACTEGHIMLLLLEEH